MKKIAVCRSAVSYGLVLFFVSCSILVISCSKGNGVDSQTAPSQTGTNKAPVAKAGNDTAIHLPTDTLWVDGSASSDPDGRIVFVEWSQIAGPRVFGNQIANHRSLKTKMQFSVAGTYAFELRIIDNKSLVGMDTVQIVVHDFVNPPSLSGKEVIFENIVAEGGPPLFNSIIHSNQYSTPGRTDLFPHAYVKTDVFLKFDSTSNWLPVTYLMEATGGGAGYLFYEIYDSRLHVYDYYLDGQKASVKVKFR